MPDTDIKQNVSRLHAAKQNKNDEFYTQLTDIEQELRHYKDQLKGKVIFCNCDDPYESNFFKYFAMNFNSLGLKKLIATSYNPSPIAGAQLALFEIEGLKGINDKQPFVIEINEVPDFNGDGEVGLEDVKQLIQHDKNVTRKLQGDSKYNAGDFRSTECLELLRQSDIVCTNPPFSLFREYLAQLIDNNKKFLIIGNKNAVNYKDVFKLIANNKLWLGYRNINSDMWFVVPEGTKYEKVVEGKQVKHIMACWFTNLDTTKRHEIFRTGERYVPEKYLTYDNYNAINIDKVTEIPDDYYEVMGVPVTFIDKYNPNQFEILGLSQKFGYGLKSNKLYNDYKEVRQDGTETGSSGRKTNGNPVMKGRPVKGNYYTNGKDFAYSLYGRIFIKRRAES